MNHAWRPVIVLACIAIVGLFVRSFFIPSDFVAKDGDYKYQWHRLGSEQDWKNFNVKYFGNDYCGKCHEKRLGEVKASGHKNIKCENCHVQSEPMMTKPPEHMKLKEKDGYLLQIGMNKERVLCLRCHANIPFRSAKLKTQDPDKHNPDKNCVECHDPHAASLKDVDF